MLPRRIPVSKGSWIRIEPLQKGLRAELHLKEGDDSAAVLKELKGLLRELEE